MKYLTRAWSEGDFSDDEADAIIAAYREHRAAVLPQLSQSVRWFAETVDVHDGLLRGVTLDRSAGTLHLALRCGDLQQGYFDVELTYRGIRLEKLDVAVLQVLASDVRPEALYLEEDVVEPGWYVHRWLWWPFRRELDIHFADLVFSRTPRPDREFAPPLSRFVEIGAPAV
jgi:hypothetical protein